jgi:hypothetical protein
MTARQGPYNNWIIKCGCGEIKVNEIDMSEWQKPKQYAVFDREHWHRDKAEVDKTIRSFLSTHPELGKRSNIDTAIWVFENRLNWLWNGTNPDSRAVNYFLKFIQERE